MKITTHGFVINHNPQDMYFTASIDSYGLKIIFSFFLVFLFLIVYVTIKHCSWWHQKQKLMKFCSSLVRTFFFFEIKKIGVGKILLFFWKFSFCVEIFWKFIFWVEIFWKFIFYVEIFWKFIFCVEIFWKFFFASKSFEKFDLVSKQILEICFGVEIFWKFVFVSKSFDKFIFVCQNLMKIYCCVSKQSLEIYFCVSKSFRNLLINLFFVSKKKNWILFFFLCRNLKQNKNRSRAKIYVYFLESICSIKKSWK